VEVTSGEEAGGMGRRGYIDGPAVSSRWILGAATSPGGCIQSSRLISDPTVHIRFIIVPAKINAYPQDMI
jgi:hypothetical protein